MGQPRRRADRKGGLTYFVIPSGVEESRCVLFKVTWPGSLDFARDDDFSAYFHLNRQTMVDHVGPAVGIAFH
jgi:hypothetical protein